MGIRPQPAQMQSSRVGGIGGHGLGHPDNTLSVDPELYRTRELIRGRIFDSLRQRAQQPINDVVLIKLRDIARRLDEGLFRCAHTKEEYMNLGTLDQRLNMMVRRFQLRRQNVNSSPSVGTMIPTPGTRNTSMTAANSSMPPTTVNTGSLLPTGGVNGGSFSRPDGNI